MERLLVSRVLASAAMLSCAWPAWADASLTLTPAGSTCLAVSGTVGSPVFSSFACSPSPDAPIVLRNLQGSSLSSPVDQLRVVLAYEFDYHDDGLALATPQTLQVGTPTADAQLPRSDPNYLRVRTPQDVSFEAATVFLDLEGSGASPFYSVSMGVSGPDLSAIGLQNGVLTFGLNDRPDDFSGILVISVATPNFPATLSGAAVSASVASVPAIPEPSTYALLAAGLAGIGLASRRRRHPHAH